MRVGRVIGSAVATAKHPSMEATKLLVIQPQLADSAADGDPVLAVDLVGAGVGQSVMISSDGKGAREFLKVDATPIRWTIIGVEDE